MWAETVFDYVDEQKVETGLNISIVFRETNSAEVENDFLPESLEIDSSVERLATYVDWYTEAAWLFIEDAGVGFEKMQNVFEALEDEGFLPYEFEEISRRYPGQIEIIELEEGFKVIDRKDGKFFTTESTDNPQQLQSNKNNTTDEKE